MASICEVMYFRLKESSFLMSAVMPEARANLDSSLGRVNLSLI